MIGRWLSPSGSVSVSSCVPAGSYTPVEDTWSTEVAVRQWAMRSPAASALPLRSTSHRPDFTTPKLRTWSTSAGRAEKSPEARFSGTQMTPRASRSVFASASLKRATANTSLSAARARTRGSATWPVAPVTTMRRSESGEESVMTAF